MSGLTRVNEVVDFNALQIPDNAVRGGEILEGKGTLVRLEDLEGIDLDVPVELIDPNPNQPREYFDPTKMAELTQSIKENGQKQQVKVVPYIVDGETRFYLVDGERRFRAVTETGQSTARANVEWYASEEEIFIASFLFNLEREDHNQIEEAKSYKRILDMQMAKGMNKGDAENRLAEIVSKPVIRVQNMIKLLELPQEVQDMVATGELPDRHALNLIQAKKKYGASLNVLKLARTIVDNPEGELEVAKRGRNAGEVTAASVKAFIRKKVLEQEALTPEQAAELEVAEAVLKVSTAVSVLTNSMNRLLKVDRGMAIKALQNRGRGNPPEALARDLKAVLRLSKELVEGVIMPATEAPALEKLPGRPEFADYVAEKLKEDLKDVHYWIAYIFACASDNQTEVVTAAETAEAINDIEPNLDIDSNIVAQNMPFLEIALKRYGLAVDTVVKRVKTEAGIVKKNAYRLKWHGKAQ